MSDMSELPIYSGRPMEVSDLLNFEQAIDKIPSTAKMMTIDEARESLPQAKALMIQLQAISDNASRLNRRIRYNP